LQAITTKTSSLKIAPATPTSKKTHFDTVSKTLSVSENFYGSVVIFIYP